MKGRQERHLAPLSKRRRIRTEERQGESHACETSKSPFATVNMQLNVNSTRKTHDTLVEFHHERSAVRVAPESCELSHDIEERFLRQMVCSSRSTMIS